MNDKALQEYAQLLTQRCANLEFELIKLQLELNEIKAKTNGSSEETQG